MEDLGKLKLSVAVLVMKQDSPNSSLGFPWSLPIEESLESAKMVSSAKIYLLAK